MAIIFGFNKQYVFILYVLLGLVGLSGCVDEYLDVKPSGGDLTLNIVTKTVAELSANKKRNASNTRVLIIEGSNVIFNKTTDDTELLTVTLRGGQYKVAVVRNETAGMATQLDAVKNINELNAVTISKTTSDLFTEDDIPLYVEKEVLIQASSDPAKAQVQIVGSNVWSTELAMELERTHTKVSLFIRKNTGGNEEVVINKVEIGNVPVSSFLVSKAFDPASADEFTTMTPYDDPAGVRCNTNETGPSDKYDTYAMVFSANNLFPEHNKLDRKSDENATYLKLQGTHGGTPVVYTFKINELTRDYALLRNVHYLVYATITSGAQKPEIVVRPVTWDGKTIDADMLAPYLNVQELEFSMVLKENEVSDPYRLHYWTNQESVRVENDLYMYNDQVGNDIKVDINRIFPLLAGIGAANNQFNTGTPDKGNNGYLDITPAADYKNVVSSMLSGREIPFTNRFRMTLNANGLKREITIIVSQTDQLNPVHIGYTPWVGTFHRWNQTGERIIAARHTGAWTAVVMNDGSNKDNFVVISLSPSTDIALGTENPDEAENHPVYKGSVENSSAEISSVHDAGSAINGTGNIYFRIGLKSRLSSPTAKPRYARVRLTTSDNAVSYLYVRQGEADDYVYDNSESLSLSDGSSESRTEALKVSPYNLTVPRYVNGGQKLTDHYYFPPKQKAVFTPYPTNVGWYFTWYFNGSTPYYSETLREVVEEYDPNYRRAFHPFNPAYRQSIDESEIDHFPRTTLDKHRNSIPDRTDDPCPYGYKMMSYKNLLHSLFMRYSKFTPSLQDGQKGFYPYREQGSNLINYVWGYYADGFYDRRPTRTLLRWDGDNYYRPYQISGYDGDVSYMGALFYHHDAGKNNSIFLPGGGIRTSSSGQQTINAGRLDNIGGRAIYFLSDKLDEGARDNNTVGTFSIGASLTGNSLSYQNPAATLYEPSFSFFGGGTHATPMRCVRENYPTPATALVVFILNGATSSGSTRVTGTTTNNRITAKEGETISIEDYHYDTEATFSRGSQTVSFDGWNTSPDGSGAKYEGRMKLNAGITFLYAQWRQIAST